MANETVSLLVVSSNGVHRRFSPGRVVQVGRSAEADVKIDSSIGRVSREHASLTFEDGAWTFQNHSRRGTTLDGRSIDRMAIVQPTRLWLGDAEGGTTLALSIDERPRLGEKERRDLDKEVRDLGGEAQASTFSDFVRGSLKFLLSHWLIALATTVFAGLVMVLTNHWMTTVKYDGARNVPDNLPLFSTRYNSGSPNIGAFVFWFLLAALLGWIVGYLVRAGPRRFVLDMLRSPLGLVGFVRLDWPRPVAPLLIGASAGLVISVWLLPALSVLAAVTLLLVLPSMLGYQLAGGVAGVWRAVTRVLNRPEPRGSVRHASAAALVGTTIGFASSLVLTDPLSKLILAALLAVGALLASRGLMHSAAGVWVLIALVAVGVVVAYHGMHQAWAFADDGGSSECSSYKSRGFRDWLTGWFHCGGGYTDSPYVEVVPAVPPSVAVGGESPPWPIPNWPDGPAPNPNDYPNRDEWEDAFDEWEKEFWKEERRRLFEEIFEDRLNDPATHDEMRDWLDDAAYFYPHYPPWPPPDGSGSHYPPDAPSPAPSPAPRPRPRRRRRAPAPRRRRPSKVVPW